MLNNINNVIMKNIFKNLFKSKEIIRTNDLKPTGIRSTVKSINHGNMNDFNETWIYVHSNIRNYNQFEKDYGIKIK
jgi:hypothetical protein